MRNIAQGCGQEADIARGKTECYICLTHMQHFSVVHKCKRYSTCLL